jgi:hypothetical protein
MQRAMAAMYKFKAMPREVPPVDAVIPPATLEAAKHHSEFLTRFLLQEKQTRGLDLPRKIRTRLATRAHARKLKSGPRRFNPKICMIIEIIMPIPGVGFCWIS